MLNKPHPFSVSSGNACLRQYLWTTIACTLVFVALLKLLPTFACVSPLTEAGCLVLSITASPVPGTCSETFVNNSLNNKWVNVRDYAVPKEGLQTAGEAGKGHSTQVQCKRKRPRSCKGCRVSGKRREAGEVGVREDLLSGCCESTLASSNPNVASAAL